MGWYRGLDQKKRRFISETAWMLMGNVVFAIGVNMIITPMGLYNGGFMGVAQLLKLFANSVLHVPMFPGVDVVGIIYFAINVPLFWCAYKVMGKKFCVKSLVSVGIASLCLAVVPTPASPIFSDYFTTCFVGGVVAGSGAGMVLRSGSSGGGQDIIGVCLSKTHPNFSVGKISIVMNVCIYMVCLFLFDVEIVVYSLIYTTILALFLDRVHIQNINTTVMIFTKKKGIAAAIMTDMGRGVTDWSGEGAYTQEASYILVTVISKYEVSQLKQLVLDIDQHAFMIFMEGNDIVGNFEKRLA